MATVTTTSSTQQQNVLRHTQNKKAATPGIGVQLVTAGTAACIADLFTFPLDTTKVRLQVQGEGGSTALQGRGVLGTLFHIGKYEGPAALYSGIVPGLQRQMAFSAIRIGAYETVKNKYIELTGVSGGMQLMGVRIAAGVTTGTLAILAAQPTDVVKVRMQAAGKSQQYKGVMDAYWTIGQKEGVRNGLYRGTLPNIARNCIVNVGETVVYDAAKDGLISAGYMSEGIACHFVSAVFAGVTATLVASPVDVVKTRFMNSQRGRYRGALHCAQVTAQTEGMLAFYKGFTASCLRLVSWNIVLWLSFEQIKLAVNNHYRQKS
jgi:solute carrier family 25 uncoupling protein 8/9